MRIDPKIRDTVTFLSSSTYLSKRQYTSYVFKLCCLCLGHVVPKSPKLSLGSRDRSITGLDLGHVIEPMQSFFLNSSSEQNIFASLESIFPCDELLAETGDVALQPSYGPCSSVDLQGRETIQASLIKA